MSERFPTGCKGKNRSSLGVTIGVVETPQMQHRLPMFKDAYSRRRCILPVDGFYEWRAIKGQRAKQPYAIAMKDDKPFGIGGLWENWKDPASGKWVRTFVIITTDANELVAQIHNRMPLILAPHEYKRWLGDDAHPRDLLRQAR